MKILIICLCLVSLSFSGVNKKTVNCSYLNDIIIQAMNQKLNINCQEITNITKLFYPNIEMSVFVFKSEKKDLRGIGLDDNGEIVSISEIRDQEKKKIWEKRGNFTERLNKKLMKSNPSDRINISIAFKSSFLGKSELSKPIKILTQGESNNFVKTYKVFKKEKMRKMKVYYVKTIEKLLGDDIKSEYLPNLGLIHLNISTRDAAKLKKLEKISFIEYTDDVHIENDLQYHINNMDIDNLHAHGFDGSNIRAGVWHMDYPNYMDQMCSFTARLPLSTQNIQECQHAAYCLSSIRNCRSIPRRGTGMGPESTLFLGNFVIKQPQDPDNTPMTLRAEKALEWMMNNNVSAINHSWHTETGTINGRTLNEQYSGDRSYLDYVIDRAVINSPYPTICQAAGNGGGDEFVNHKGYNTLVVGFSTNSNDIGSQSNYRNPNSGQELPHFVTLVRSSSYCISMFDDTKNQNNSVCTSSQGTSISAALTTGLVASLMEASTLLTKWPEAVRAILMNSANVNIHGSTWSNTSDGRDGTGKINGQRAYNMAINYEGDLDENISNAGNAGWATGSFNSSQVDKYLYLNTSASQMRVTLSWTNDPDNDITDMDLSIYKKENNSWNFIDGSYSTTDPVEVVEITSGAGNYRIMVKSYDINHSPAHVGLAWHEL